MRCDMMSSTTVRAAMKVMMKPNRARRASCEGVAVIGSGGAMGTFMACCALLGLRFRQGLRIRKTSARQRQDTHADDDHRHADELQPGQMFAQYQPAQQCGNRGVHIAI